MAAPTNTYTSASMVGIREDLSDIIYDISPEETPFYSTSPKVKASNTLHEWQTDALRASADNAHLEGDDTVATASTPTVRLGNYTQIFKEAATVSGTDTGLTKAGRQKEMKYQVLKRSKELKLDIEKALFANTAKVGSGIRRLAGLPTWLTTNTDVAAGGSDATGDGSDTRTDAGTPAAFSQTRFDTVMQSIWDSGGKADCVYLSSFQMNVALGFDGNNNQRPTLPAKEGKVINTMVAYQTPWGTVDFIMTRENRSRDVFILQKDMFAIANLRPVKNTELAKTGDSEKRQIVAELTLECRNEAASGMIADCTTS